MRLRPMLALGAATLLCGVSHLGCSNSSSGGGFASTSAASTTPAAVTSGQTGTTTPASTIPAAPASVGQPLTTFNAELQGIWADVLPMLTGSINTMAATKLQGQKYSSSAVDVDVVNVRLGPTTDMATAPGMLAFTTKDLVLRMPVQGTWQIALEADLQVTVKIGSFSPAINLPVTIALDDLSLEVAVDFDDSDPTRPVLQRVGKPKLDFKVRIDSNSSLVAQLTNVLNKPVDWIAQQAVGLALNAILPQLSALQGVPGPIPADGAAPLLDSGRATPFQEIVENAEIKARQINMPHGTVLNAYMDTDATDTWVDAYQNGGTGLQGSVVRYASGGDSAIWTGHFLAGEAFRYAVTGDSLALDNLGHLLSGVGALLDVNGGTGLLARNCAPENSLVGQNIKAAGVFRSAQIRGQTWIGRQGSKGISRDQYSGVFFGLSVAYELVPALRPECEFRLKQMLDYLISNDWLIDEDRPAWTGGPSSSRGPTFWAGVNYQKLAFLLMGHRMDPARYATELAQAGPLSETAWFGMWTATFGFDHYYKYNLSHVGLYNYFRLETDPQRWQDLRRAYAIIERYVGHHRNAHFDLIQTSIDAAAKVDLFPSTREAMRQFLDMNHREVANPVIDLSGVTFVQLQLFGYNNTASGGVSLGGATQSVPTEPLAMPLRRPSGHFQWQRDPFTPATPNEGSAKLEKIGLDLTLPYWMGRYMGAFQ